MGISFKVSKTGKRSQPKSVAASFPAQDEESNEMLIDASEKKSGTISSSTRKLAGETGDNRGETEISDKEVSFTLSLFPDGYSIAKPMENESGRQTSIEVPKFLHPYDRASETLFSAIESGRLPGDILDDIPCKYVDGTLVCELRDYRKCFPEVVNMAAEDSSPVINRFCLKMSLENIVKDIPSISDNGWTYGDLMEVESRILKALQPQLCLNPTPQLDRLSDKSVPSELNLAIHSMRMKRLRQISEVSVSSNNIQGKRVCLPESSGSLMHQQAYENLNTQNNLSSSVPPLRNNSFGSDGSLLPSSPLVSHQSKYLVGSGSPRMMKDQRSGSLLNASVVSPGGPDMMIPFSDNGASSIHVSNKSNQDGPLSPLNNKKPRLVDSLQTDNLQALMQQQSIARGMQYGNNSMQKFSPQIFEGQEGGGSMPFTIGQQGMRYNLKEEPMDNDKPMMGESELSNMDPSRMQQQQQPRMPHQFIRPGFPQTPWNNLDNNSRKEESFQKRKLVPSPHVSAGGLPQSPLSSKSGEFSSGSIGHQFGAVVSQKEKSAVTSLASVGGNNPSFTSSANDSMQRQTQAQATGKRRSGSVPKPTISGVGSPASVGNMSVPINASSPPVGHQPLGDQSMLDRFSKIEVVTMRCQLNRKRNKVDEYPIKRKVYTAQQLASLISSDLNNENLKEEYTMPLSKSLVGGNMNVSKIRILTFLQIQGNSFQLAPKSRTRMIMSEKPHDGSVAFHIGEIDDAEYLAAEDYLPTLPNTHTADLLASQFSSLLVREGYHMEDHVQPRPVRANTPGIPPNSEMQQFSEGSIPIQQSNDIAKTGNVPTQNMQVQRLLPQGNNPALQMSQGFMPSRPQQPEQLPPQQPQQQQQQQQPQFQRSPMMQIPANSMQHLNNMAQNANLQQQLGQHMMNKPPPLQLLQQQQQPQLLQSQQQHPQNMQRKMMPGLGTVGMGNIGNNMVALGGLSNVMGMGGARGVGGSGISAPMGAMSSMGNINQNPMNLNPASSISNAIRSGTITQSHLMKLRMAQAQNRPNLLGNPQSSIGNISGARQMHPGSTGLSMLGPALNRANISQMQRTAMGQMGPPKLMPGMNLYMNQQQQQQQLQQQQQMQQQLQQQQQMQQLHQQQQLQQQQQQQLHPQQETTSPLQAVLSPPQVGSPSTSMGIPQQQQQQQQASPQQMSQRTPMSPQLSSGAMHAINGGNPEACPASPQLSSQTMGSVGSINNSPMEQLQGANKSNSVNNA